MAATVLLLGAGFSAAAGMPLGADLMMPPEFAHSRTAAKGHEVVLRAWEDWRAQHPQEVAEQFITAVYERDVPDAGVVWPLLLVFLAHRLAYPITTFYGRKPTGDNILEARLSSAHREWWSTLLRLTNCGTDLSVLTTNWDIWIERALRPRPMQRPPRPGFHYGWGAERLEASRAFPRSRWWWDPWIEGSVPVLKLHGSLNWAVKEGRLVKYGDCRPALRGDAALVPPVKHKQPPAWALPLWSMAQDALSSAKRVIVVGYSVPEYDDRMRDLLRVGLASSGAEVHVLDPASAAVKDRLSGLVPGVRIASHAGLPDGTALLPQIL